MPRGLNRRCRVNSANDMPLTRETRIAARLKPELLYDQRVPGVKLSERCRRQDVDHVRVRVDPRGARPAGDPGDAAPVAESAGVRQEMTNGDRRAVVGQLGMYFRIGSSSDSLPSRASSRTAAAVNCFDTEPASKIVSAVRHAAFEIGHAESLLEHAVPVELDADRASRRGDGPLREQRVDVGRPRRARPPASAAANSKERIGMDIVSSAERPTSREGAIERRDRLLNGGDRLRCRRHVGALDHSEQLTERAHLPLQILGHASGPRHPAPVTAAAPRRARRMRAVERARQRVLLAQAGFGRLHPRIHPDHERRGPRLAVDGEPHGVGPGQRPRSERRARACSPGSPRSG